MFSFNFQSTVYSEQAPKQINIQLNDLDEKILFPNLDHIYYCFHARIYSLTALIRCPAHQIYSQNTVVADLVRKHLQFFFFSSEGK